MHDIYFSYAMLMIGAACFGLYGMRLVVLGRVRHRRADQDGGSLFVGKRFMEVGYWLMEPIVSALYRARVTPNMVTAFSLVPGLLAGVAASQGWFGLACMLSTTTALCDIIDGLLARRRGAGSDAGEVFDAATDRYTELAFIGGLVVYYRFSGPLCALAVAALGGAFMVSYCTAKAESLGIPPPRGSMRRAERAIYLMFASGFTPAVGALVGADAPLIVQQSPILLATALVAVVANVSTVRRTAAIMRALRARDAQRAAAAAAGAAGAAAVDSGPGPHRNSGEVASAEPRA